MQEYIIKTTQLTKRFKSQAAVDCVNLTIEKGAIYGFIGRNGAGKTTFLKLISGLSHPTSGEITLFGKTGIEAKSHLDRIGVLIENPGLYPDMTAYDNLKLKAMCIGLYTKEYIEEILELVGLKGVGKKKVKHFSLGMKQRLGIGMALIGEPDLLILDEPINGLDPQGIKEVREIILKLNKERHITVVISSHILEELTKVATHYGIIHEGKVMEELTAAELVEKCEERMEIRVNDVEKASTVLDELGIHCYKVVDSNRIYVYERLQDIGTVNEGLVSHGIFVSGIGVYNESLENYFMNLTGGNHHA